MFTYAERITHQQYPMTANPIMLNLTGQRDFLTDYSGVITRP